MIPSDIHDYLEHLDRDDDDQEDTVPNHSTLNRVFSQVVVWFVAASGVV